MQARLGYYDSIIWPGKVFDIYVKSEVKEAVDKAVKKAEKNTAMKTEKNTAIKLLKTGKFSIDEIRDIFPGFDDDDILNNLLYYSMHF